MNNILESVQRAITQEIMLEMQQAPALHPFSARLSQRHSPVENNEQLFYVPVGISNRHVHLSRSDMDILFGAGSSLTRLKAVKQPGQFAAKETVTLKGAKREIQNVRILGPLRNETQIEVSISDSFTLGISAPVKMSGDLADTPGIEIIGPKGRITKDYGVIIAWRHIHMPLDTARKLNLTDWQKVNVEITGSRGGVLHNVLIRTAQEAVTELHIDTEEANAFQLKNDQLVKIMPTL